MSSYIVYMMVNEAYDLSDGTKESILLNLEKVNPDLSEFTNFSEETMKILDKLFRECAFNTVSSLSLKELRLQMLLH